MIAGVDFSSHFVDIVKLDEETDRAEWHRFPLAGVDAFDRARSVPLTVPRRSMAFWDDVLAVGVEDPRGYGAGSLYRIQGAVLACIPAGRLVQPWIPSAWRRAVGLSGRASKQDVATWAVRKLPDLPMSTIFWPQDAYDAYCIALATRSLLQMKAA